MSIGPLSGLIGSVAGSPLSQAKGSEVERSQQDAVSQQRQVQSEVRSETAAGIGAADGEDKEASERDADGRRLWEVPLATKAKLNAESAAAERHSRDASGQAGNSLDLSG